MVTFSDIFKNSFLESSGNLTTASFAMSMLACYICAMIIYFIYRNFYKGVIYNNNLNILLVLVSLITCFIVMVISSNIALSLGMVGALSIVRFRTAIKDPLDVGFLFFSISVGIVTGAGLYLFALAGTVMIALAYIILINIKTKKRIYMLLISYEKEVESQLETHLQPLNKILKNKTSTRESTEATYEIKIYNENTSFLDEISALPGVHSAMVVDFTGDYME